MAYFAVRKSGMFGEESGYISSDSKDTSEKYNAKVDQIVKKILDESYARVTKLLASKEKELRAISKNLYYYDYLDEDELKLSIEGRPIKKEKVRTWKPEEPQYLIKF
jgi:ATP-dependent Zn protease